MQLYNFFRSGTSHRLRIALNLKGLCYDYVAVDLRTNAHQSAAFKALNPQGLVPALQHEGRVLIQSPAIIEWLEERYPSRRCCRRMPTRAPRCVRWQPSSAATSTR